MSQKIKTSVEIDGSLSASQIANATTDTDKFLVSDGGTIKYRTGAELATDLGISAGTTSKVQHQVKAVVAINKGQAVYVTSADGTNMIVGLASNATEATSSKTIGLLNATVVANGFADVITEGLLDGLNTSTATVGDPIWLGTGGNLIYGLANKPYAPNHLVFIGIVTRVNANNGEIFVKVQNGFELDEIHDIDLKTTTKINGHLLGYNGSLWVNKTIAEWLGYTPYNASNPAGYISSYTETDTLASVTSRGATTTSNISTGTISTLLGGGINLRNSANTANVGGFSRRGSWEGNSNYDPAIWAETGYGLYFYTDGSATTKMSLSTVGNLTVSGTTTGSRFNNIVIGSGTYKNTISLNGDSNLNISTPSGAVFFDTYAEANGSLRAPIFYDLNDTSYYTNPASTSVLSSVVLRGASAISFYGAGNGTYNIGSIYSSTSINSWEAPLETDSYTAARVPFILTWRGGYAAKGGLKLTGDASGELGGNVILHAGNISSYAVPTSRTITINGTSYDLSANRSWTVTGTETDTLQTVTSRGNTSSNPIILRTSYPYMQFEDTVTGTTKFAWQQLGVTLAGSGAGGGGYFTTYSQDKPFGWTVGGNQGVMTIDTSGNVQALTSSRAPIFYDSNNTGYYVDPAGMSYLDRLVVNNSTQANNLLTIGGTFSGDWQSLTNTTGQANWVQVENIAGGAHSNYPSGVYTYGGVLSFRGSSHSFQLYSSHTGDLAFKTQWGNDNYSGWRNILHTGNYASYSNFGGNAVYGGIFYDGNNTGYYGDFASTSRQYQAISFGDSTRYSAINTTINGAGAGDKLILYGDTFNYDARLLVGADYDMLFKSQGNSAGKGSFKFYSGLNSALALTIDGYQNTSINGSLSVSGGSSWFGGYGGGSGPGLAFENQNTFARIVFWGLDFYDWNHGTQMVIDNGYVLANNSMRSPIFYDSNDTTYYGDFASTSYLRHLSVGDVNAANDAGWNARLNLTGSSHARLDVKSNSDGIITTMYSHTGQGVGRIGTMSNHPLAFMVNGNIAGYAYANYLHGVDSVRSPIFYDSDNTAFYINGASTTRLNTLMLSALASDDGMIENNTGAYFHLGGWGVGRTASTAVLVNTAYRSDYSDSVPWSGVTDKPSYLMYYQGFNLDANTMATNATGFTYSVNAPYTGPIVKFSTGGGYDLQLNSPYGGNGYGLAFRTRNGDAGSNNSWQYPAVYNVNANGGGDLYATRYYDQNNTGYYLDPNSISYLSTLRISDASSGASLIVGTNDTSRVYSDDPRKQLAVNADYYPCLYVNALSNNGNTTHGAVISMSGNLNSGGYRRWGMGIANTNPGIFSIGYADNNSNPHYGVGGSGWSQFWIGTGGDVYATDSFRSPIFYDSNDTGYYTNPAGSSYMSTVDARSFVTSGNPWGTSNSAWFPNGITTPNVTSWLYGTVYLGNAPGNGSGTQATASGHIISTGEHQAAIFYDYNNTAYYVDAASNSVLNTLTVQGGTNNFNGITYFRTNNGGYCGSTDSAKLQAYSDSNNSAFLSFHKGGHYATNMGLDADNVIRIGGWSASANRLQLDMSGNLTLAGDVTAYSDSRVKENVVTVENAIEKVNALRGVYYNRIDSEDKRTKLGVIAQEILEVVPEVVGQDNDGMYNVSYGNLAGLFIEAIKEQQTQIEQLKELVNQLINK